MSVIKKFSIRIALFFVLAIGYSSTYAMDAASVTPENITDLATRMSSSTPPNPNIHRQLQILFNDQLPAALHKGYWQLLSHDICGIF